MLCFGARWSDSKTVIVKSVHVDGKEDMLQTLWELLNEADALVSWNGRGFDSRHAKREFIEAGMTPPSPTKEIDLMVAVKNQFKAPSNKLDYWAQNLGIGKKKDTGGFQLWLDCMAGDDTAWKRMIRYQKQDVNLLVELYDKLLPWIPNHPNRAVYDSIPNGCIACGSPDHLQKRGFQPTTTGLYQRYQCAGSGGCGKWQRGRSILSGSEMRAI